MAEMKQTGFDPKAIDDAKVFSEIYIKLPSDKKAMVIAFMKGMEAAKETAETESADALLTR